MAGRVLVKLKGEVDIKESTHPQKLQVDKENLEDGVLPKGQAQD